LRHLSDCIILKAKSLRLSIDWNADRSWFVYRSRDIVSSVTRDCFSCGGIQEHLEIAPMERLMGCAIFGRI
jgi:hypothetical protein